MKNDILFVDVKESHTEPFLLLNITAPAQMTIIERRVNNNGSDHVTKKEIMDGVEVYVQPDTRKLDVYILYQGKRLREFTKYYDNLKIKNYSQFPVLPIVLEDDAWKIKITGSHYSGIAFDEAQINRILSDDDTRQKWHAITDDNMELSMVITKPERLTILAAYEQELKGPQGVDKPDAVNIYCNRETYAVKIEAQRDHIILFSYLTKMRASCFIKNLSAYPRENMVLSTDDHKWTCIIEGDQNSSISIESDFLRDAIESDKKLAEQQQARRKKLQKEQMQRLLDIIDGKIKPPHPQKIMEFQNPDSVFINSCPEDGREAAFYEHLSEVEIDSAPAINALVLHIKPEGQSYPEVHHFPCKEWRIIWDTNDFLGTEDYCFCSDENVYFSVSSNQRTNIQFHMDIYDRIETMPGD